MERVLAKSSFNRVLGAIAIICENETCAKVLDLGAPTTGGIGQPNNELRYGVEARYEYSICPTRYRRKYHTLLLVVTFTDE